MDVSAFYATVATASAAVFGVGGAILGSRVIGLSERAVQLELERGDYTNVLDRDITTEWAERARRDAIADIHDIVGKLKGVLIALAVLLFVLLLVPALVLAGAIPDAPWLRGVLLVVLSGASGGWVLLLAAIIANLSRVTSGAAHARDRERKEKHAEGEHSYLLTGDRQDLQRDVGRVIPPELRRKWKTKRWLRKLGRDPKI